MNSDIPVIVFQPLFTDVTIPLRKTVGAAGYDVCVHLRDRTVMVFEAEGSVEVHITDDRLIIPAFGRAQIPLGFRTALPFGLEAQIRMRSSVALRKGLIIPNSPATIDSDFPGEWQLLLANVAGLPVFVTHMERLAQIVFAQHVIVQWREDIVSPTTERGLELGTTGV